MSEFQLKEAPTDGISSLKFSPKNSISHHEQNLLLVSSWDSQVRLYDIDDNQLKASYKNKSLAAVLDCCFGGDSSHCFSGGLDNTLYAYDFHAQKETIVGMHDEVEYSIRNLRVVFL